MNDTELLQACRSGSRQAWDLFIGRYGRLIHWSIARTLERTPLSSRAGLAEEIFQDVFSGFLAPGQLERLAGVTYLKRFLVVTAANRALDHVRRITREEGRLVFPDAAGSAAEAAVSWEALEDPRGAPGSDALLREKQELVRGLIEGLGAKERFCVRMHYLEGATHREIAEVLGVPQDTVSTTIRRAKEKLKQRLEGSGYP